MTDPLLQQLADTFNARARKLRSDLSLQILGTPDFLALTRELKLSDKAHELFVSDLVTDMLHLQDAGLTLEKVANAQRRAQRGK